MLAFRVGETPCFVQGLPNSLGSHSYWQLEKQVLRVTCPGLILLAAPSIWFLPSFNLVLHAGLNPLRKIQKLMMEMKKKVHSPPDFPHGDRVMAEVGEGKEKTPSKAPP